MSKGKAAKKPPTAPTPKGKDKSAKANSNKTTPKEKKGTPADNSKSLLASVAKAAMSAEKARADAAEVAELRGLGIGSPRVKAAAPATVEPIASAPTSAPVSPEKMPKFTPPVAPSPTPPISSSKPTPSSAASSKKGAEKEKVEKATPASSSKAAAGAPTPASEKKKVPLPKEWMDKATMEGSELAAKKKKEVNRVSFRKNVVLTVNTILLGVVFMLAGLAKLGALSVLEDMTVELTYTFREHFSEVEPFVFVYQFS